jgi:hypothetical protein
VVTGPGAPPITTVDDLAGQKYPSAKGASTTRARDPERPAEGPRQPPVVITVAPDVLEDDDVLEMVNAGPPRSPSDDYLAEF